MPIKTIAIVPISRGGGRKAPSPARREHDDTGPIATAVRPAVPRRTHRFRVGERLHMLHTGNRFTRSGEFCKVVSLMPDEGHGVLLYRVRSEAEQFERIVAEGDLSRHAPGP